MFGKANVDSFKRISYGSLPLPPKNRETGGSSIKSDETRPVLRRRSSLHSWVSTSFYLPPPVVKPDRGPLRMGRLWTTIVIIELLMNHCEFFLSSYSVFSRRGEKTIGSSYDLYFSRCIGSFGGILVGFVADFYTGHYAFALLSSLALWVPCAVYVGLREILYHAPDYSLPFYRSLNYHIAQWTAGIFTALGFTRMTYALLYSLPKKRSDIELFLVALLWSGTKLASGGVVYAVLMQFKELDHLTITFIFSGLCLLIFTYVLKPERRSKDSHLIVKQVAHHVGIALKTKILRHAFRKSRKKHTLKHPSHRAIIAALSSVFVQLIPTFGLLIVVAVVKCGLATPIINQTTPSILEATLGPLVSWKLYTLSSTILTHSLFRCIRLAPKWKFLIGYAVAGVYMIFCTHSYFRIDGQINVNSETGGIWLFNARDLPVVLEADFSHLGTPLNIKVGSKQTVHIYQIGRKRTLAAMRVTFEGSDLVKNNKTILFYVIPNELTGYLLDDPPAVVRIPGNLPIRMKSRKTHHLQETEFFLFNVIEFISGESLKIYKDKHLVKELKVKYGKPSYFQLPPGDYTFRVSRTTLESSFTVGNGGLYGCIITDTSKIGLNFVKVVSSDILPQYTIIVMGILYGVALTLALVYIQCETFLRSPRNLLGMTCGFINLLQGLEFGWCTLGWLNWHPYMTGFHFSIYAYTVAFGLFLTVYLKIVYDDQFCI